MEKLQEVFELKSQTLTDESHPELESQNKLKPESESPTKPQVLTDEPDSQITMIKKSIQECIDTIIQMFKTIETKQKNNIDVIPVLQMNFAFKKIRIFFKILDMIAYILVCTYILKCDPDKHEDGFIQDTIERKVVFPCDIESLAFMVGVFGDNFSDELKKDLFEILDFGNFSEFGIISKIPEQLEHTLSSGDIKINALNTDVMEFNILVKKLFTHILSTCII
jgi:hypothetical protein